MGLLRRCLWPFGTLAAAAAFAGCAAITGLSDLQRDDCAFGCDAGRDGERVDSAAMVDADRDSASVDGDATMGGDGSLRDAAQDGASDAVARDAPPPVDAPVDAPPEAAPTCGTLGQPCCGTACNAPLTCQGGQTCVCTMLPLCNGSCVDETADPANCAACGHACAAGANQTATCSSGMCGTRCNTGYADCADAGTSCATSTATDPSNCGSCGTVCPVAGQICSGGMCACPAGWRLCGSINKCVDVSSDPNNCGSCAHSCLGGGCTAGACQPVSLAPVNAPVGIAIDSSFVYFTSPTAGTVAKVPTGGGSVVPIAGSQDAPTGVAVDAVNVYWAQNDPNGTSGGVSKAALPNGSPVVPLVTGQSAFYLVTDGVKVYFTRGQFGAVLSVPVGGGSPTPIWSGNKFPYTIAMDGLNVYWGVFNNNLGIYKVPFATGSPVTEFVSGYNNTQGVAADGTSIYFTTYLTSGGVYKTDPNGTSVVPLTTGLPRPFGIAVDSNYAYVTTLTAVVRVPLSGGAAVPLASDNTPQQIAVDSKAIYWASGTGAILKLAK
jgi:hypothetical protein